MGGNICPPALEVPNAQVGRGRLMLQVLAGVLLGVTALALAVKMLFALLFLLICVFLFVSWRTFNWNVLLFVFFFACIELVQVSIQIVGMVQAGAIFAPDRAFKNVVFILIETYFLACLIISHHTYKVFKDYQMNPTRYAGLPTTARPPNANQPFAGQGVRIG